MIFPDGDCQEIFNPLQPGTLVDMNGNILNIPLPTNKMIVYEIVGKRTSEERGIVKTYYQMDQLTADELLDYI